MADPFGVNWALDKGWFFELSDGCRDESVCRGDEADLPVMVCWFLVAVCLRHEHYKRFPYPPPPASS